MKKVLAIILKATISLALLYLAIGQIDVGVLGQRLAQISPIGMAAAFSVLMLQSFFVALRWRMIALHCEAPVTVFQSFRFTLVANLFNQALPSTMGGDAARVWLLARQGAGVAKATYSVIIDRAVGVLVLACLVLACLPWSFALIHNPTGRAALVVIGLICLVCPAAFIALGMRRWPLFERRAITRYAAEAAGAAGGLLRHPITGAAVALMSLAVHLLTIAAAWLAARSVAVPLEFGHALLLVLPVLMISMVPISIAGWGVREGAMVMAFAYAGLSESDGLLVSVLLGGMMFAVGAVGGLVWLMGGASFGMPIRNPGRQRQTP